jgi:serine/threonine-protein kinase ATR
VKGILVRNPDWENMLVGFQVEGARMAGAWDEVQTCIEKVQESDQTPSIAMAKLLLALRAGDPDAITAALSRSRLVLGTPITAAGAREYRRSYEAVLGLHLTHELEMIYEATSQRPKARASALNNISVSLTSRLESTLPTFRTREPILSMRRTAFALAYVISLCS